MKNQVKNSRFLHRLAAKGLLALAALWLGGCVTHYYPAAGGAYGDYPLSRPYVAVTADVPAPGPGVAADNVILYVDSVYYPWWSLDYFYLGYGHGYGYGYGGLSLGIRYGYPRPYYRWPYYAWYNPWYYPPYYSAWYPSHYWRPYYHPHHYYWAHRYQRNPPYGHRPAYDRHAGSNSWSQPSRTNGRQDGDQRRGSTGGLTGPAAPAPATQRLGGTLAGRPAVTAYRPAPPSNAETMRARPAFRAPQAPRGNDDLASANAPGARVISRSPGFSAATPAAAAAPARPVHSTSRVIGQPDYRAPVRSVSPVVQAPSPGAMQPAPSRAPIMARPPLGNARISAPGVPPSPVRNVPSGAAPVMSRPQPSLRVPSGAYAPASRPPAPASAAVPPVRSAPRMSTPPLRAATPSRPATRTVARPEAKPKN